MSKALVTGSIQQAVGRSALLDSPTSTVFPSVPPFLKLFFNANHIEVVQLLDCLGILEELLMTAPGAFMLRGKDGES